MRFMAAAVAVLTAMLVTGAGVRQATHADRTPALLTEGIAASPCAPQHVIIVPPHRDVRYEGNASVLLTGSGTAAGGGGGSPRRARARPPVWPRAGHGSRPGPFRE